MIRNLDVLIAGHRAGNLSQDDSGVVAFRYDKDYRGVPLSYAMPRSTREYRDKVVLPYLWGLLPEDPSARRSIAEEAGVSPSNPFALLGVIGLDCPGAVQFCREGSQEAREERLVPMSDGEIARRLSKGRNEEGSWTIAEEHWSLGGQQSKFALRQRAGEWYSCKGAAATTHILKGGVRGLASQALNEYVCMKLAEECGISAAKVQYREFDGDDGIEPAIIVERYDRLSDGDSVARLHQEDLCQALGCLPENKYTMNGGPSANDVLELLASTGSMAQANVASFLQMLFFNYLLAATDAHAKNYSILLREDGAHCLAPMYDVASIAPYKADELRAARYPKLSMSIGGENRVARVSRRNLAKMVEQCGLEDLGIAATGCADLLATYADAIPGKLSAIFDDLEGTRVGSAARELRCRMEEPIALICSRSKARLLS